MYVALEPILLYHSTSVIINNIIVACIVSITPCESIEKTLRTTRLLWSGTLIRLSGGLLPKRRIYSETLRMQCGEDGAGRRKSRSIAFRATSGHLFGIAGGGWKATALEAEV